jgi:hypothetical protein
MYTERQQIFSTSLHTLTKDEFYHLTILDNISKLPYDLEVLLIK